MRKVFAGLALTFEALFAALLVLSCAGTDTAVYEGDGLSLMEAIEQSAEKIAADLPADSRVAFAAWESPSQGLSDYIQVFQSFMEAH
jgi:hypothetical protein